MVGASNHDVPQREVMLVCRRFDDKTDLSGLCRICLLYLHPSEMTRIFPSTPMNWKEIINNITDIEVNAGDGLPAMVCSLCVSKLNHTKELKEKSIAGNDLLRNTLVHTRVDLRNKRPQRSTNRAAALPSVHTQQEGVTDMSIFCRLCVTYFAPDKMTPIFEDNGPDLLLDKITSVTQIKVSRGDGLPDSICECCVANLRRASEFIADASAKDVYLRTELFQVKPEACETNELDVKLEPDEAAEDLAAADTTLSLPSRARIKTEAENDRGVQDDAERRVPTNSGQSPLSKQRLEAKTAAASVSESDLVKRVRGRLNANKRTFQCANCLSGFAARNALQDHLPCKKKQRQAKTSSSNNGSDVAATDGANNFVCEFCKKMYVSKKAVMAHMSRLHKFKTQPFKCNQCISVFLRQAPLDEHKRTCHERKSGKSSKRSQGKRLEARPEAPAKSIQCANCLTAFASRAGIKKHLPCTRNLRQLNFTSSSFTGNDASSFLCYFCKKIYTSKIYVLDHIKNFHNFKRQPFKCNQCTRVFLHPALLEEHLRTSHQPKVVETFHCDVCAKKFTQKSQLAAHMKVHSDARPFNCPVCLKAFKHPTHVDTHMKTHNTLKSYKCNICAKEFRWATFWKKHAKTHSKDYGYKCETCDFRSYRKDVVIKHQRDKHSTVRPYVCQSCGRSYKMRGELTRHVKAHMFVPKVCTECGMMLSSAQAFTNHMRRHRGDLPYACDLCKKSFLVKLSLRRHMETHMERTKQFRCHICAKMYVSKSSLSSHLGLHGNRRDIQYKCALCPSSYDRKLKLEGHIFREHAKEKPYKCGDCAEAFFCRSRLKSHMASHKRDA